MLIFSILNQSEIVLEANYDLYPNKYFEILIQTFGGRSPETKRSWLHSNSQDKIR